MFLNKDVFSLRDVSTGEASQIRQMWGGRQADADTVGFFLEVGGRPLLRTSPYLIRYLGGALNGTLDQIEASPQATRAAFQNGALLYAGVFGHLNRATELPITDEAIDTIGDLDSVDFVIASHDGIGKQGERFCELLDEVVPIMGLSREAKPAAYIGAGALHLVMQESERRMNDLTAFEAAPELADLQEMFKAFGA